MQKISMYYACVPTICRALNSLAAILEKAEAHAEAKKFDPLVLTDYRLAPDMLPFRKQVQIACDASKNGLARLSGVEAPKFDDTETTLAELKERIRKTIDYLDSVPRASIDGCEDKDITFRPPMLRIVVGDWKFR